MLTVFLNVWLLQFYPKPAFPLRQRTSCCLQIFTIFRLSLQHWTSNTYLCSYDGESLIQGLFNIWILKLTLLCLGSSRLSVAECAITLQILSLMHNAFNFKFQHYNYFCWFANTPLGGCFLIHSSSKAILSVRLTSVLDKELFGNSYPFMLCSVTWHTAL
jgi:hypothetical protein